LTANVLAGNAEMFLNNGFDGFIGKPIDIRHLTTILNDFIRNKQPQEVLEAVYKQEEELNRLNRSNKDSSMIEDESTMSSQIKTQLLEANIIGLDVAKGIKRYKGDVETYTKILRSYVAGLRSMMGSNNTVTKDDLQDYKLKVHSIKGTSYDILADSIGKKAEDLEIASVTGNMDYINKNNPILHDEVMKLVDDIETVLEQTNKSISKPKKDKPDVRYLKLLHTACEKYDIDNAEAAMSELDEYQYESDEGLIDWLRDNIDMMRFPQIVERLSEYLEKQE